MRKMITFMIALLVVGMLLGCERNAIQDDDNVIDSELIITEKVLPEDFYEIADQGMLVKKVTNQEDFIAQWEYYGLTESHVEIDWDNKIAIFLGIFESGSCPFTFNYAALSEENTELLIHIETDSEGPCTDDATPRTMVVVVDADQLSDVNHIEIINYYGSNSRTEF